MLGTEVLVFLRCLAAKVLRRHIKNNIVEFSYVSHIFQVQQPNYSFTFFLNISNGFLQ